MALDIVRSTLENGGIFELILMDINMPVMNGLETTKKICEIYLEKKLEHPIIIGQSGDSDESLSDQCKKVGISCNIMKPFSFANFKDMMREHHVI